MTPTERLKGIEVFVCAADAGSFTAAAERLNLSNSAVGKAVARLEQRLGARLFERSTRAMALTDAGAAFYATCVRVLADLGEAESVLAAHRLEPAGHLRVDAGAAFGRLKVLPLLIEFARQHPAVTPQLSLTDRMVDLVDDGIDVAVRIGGSDAWPAPLAQRYLATERLIFCAAPAYLQRRGTPATADDLARHDCVVYGRADGSVAPWLLRDGPGPARRLAVDGRIVVGNGEAQVDAVLAGCGVAQLATWLVGEHLATGRLLQILPQLSTAGLPLHLVWQRSRQLLPKVDAVLEVLARGLDIG